MKTYQFSTPPRVPGVYLVRHKPTDRLYVGRTVDLSRRYSEWKMTFSAHLGVKSFRIKELLEEGGADEWEFSILAELPGATEEQLADYETRAVTRIGNRAPERLLNTIAPSNPKAARAPGAATSPKSSITLEGRTIAYSVAAKILGCSVKQVQKRMARYREKGIFEVDVGHLKTLSEKYRAEKP